MYEGKKNKENHHNGVLERGNFWLATYLLFRTVISVDCVSSGDSKMAGNLVKEDSSSVQDLQDPSITCKSNNCGYI